MPNYLRSKRVALSRTTRMNSPADYLDELGEKLRQNPSNHEVRFELAEVTLVTAHTLFDRLWDTDNPAELDVVVEWYKRAIELAAPELEVEYIEAFYRMAFCVHFQSKMELALVYVREALERQQRVIEKHPLGATNIRFLQHRSGTLTNIGHLANEPEIFGKMEALGLREKLRGVLLAPRKDVVNNAFLEYWKPSLLAVTDEALVRRFRPLARELEYNTFWVKIDGKVHFQWPAMNIVHGLWEREGRAPLLRLTADHVERGRAALLSVGVPRDAWFVTLHVRDQRRGKLGKPIKASTTSNRDAVVESYFDAIKRITDEGGWVVRLGDVSMPELPPMKHVIDYPHSGLKQDWMDIFLLGASRFLLGTASGLQGVANNFGTPVLLTNVSPTNSWPLSKNDLYLPKLIRERASGRILDFRTALSEPFSYCYSKGVYNQAGVEIVDNTPEEILEATDEMLLRTASRWRDTPQDVERQERFQKLVRSLEPYGIQCRIGNAFIRRYEGLL